MEKVLFVAHTDETGSLPKAALEALTAAKSIGGSLTVGLIGAEVQAAADSIAACGADRFIAVTGEVFGESRYSTDAAAVTALVQQADATVVVAPTTARFARCLPGAAARCGGRIDTHITALLTEKGALEAQRWFYRQRMVATLSRTQRPWFLTIDAGVFEAFSGAGSASVEQVTVDAGTPRTTVVGIQTPDTGAQTIRPEAELLFVAGAGWTKKQADGQVHMQEASDTILDFLGATKASLGSTKSLVDQEGEGGAVLSFMSHLNQVGQTGSTPRHRKGLATCCHGEEPHTVGWRFIGERRAISLDPNCGWAQGKADVLYVADAFEVMSKVNALLKG